METVFLLVRLILWQLVRGKYFSIVPRGLCHVRGLLLTVSLFRWLLGPEGWLVPQSDVGGDVAVLVVIVSFPSVVGR